MHRRLPLTTWVSAIGILALAFALLLSTSYATHAESWQDYIVGTHWYNGKLVYEVIVPGRPPDDFRAPVVMLPAGDQAGTTVLPGVPALDWCYGCSATSAAMMFGYSDNPTQGYTNMYAGPTNGGLFPLNNSVWGSGECPLSATHMGYDGLTTHGHVDDYWIDYGQPGPDPYVINGWTEHTHADCTADFMGTNQWKYQCTDGATYFFFNTDGSPLYDYPDTGGYRDGCHGMRLFVESRGYTVLENFTQLIMGYGGNTQGYTFSDFQNDIDAGRPVMIQVAGHSMLGFGYDTVTNAVYIHDTWDYSDHQMTWGADYYGMEHYGVTVVRMAPAIVPALPDMLIRIAGETSYTGDDIYNTTGAGQTKSQSVGMGETAIYELQLENDGVFADTFTITGPAGGTGWTVTYYNAHTGGTDITAAVTGAGWTTPSIAPGSSIDLRVEMSPDGSAPNGVAEDVLVTATSDSYAMPPDAVKASTTRFDPYLVDVLVRNAGETSYAGDNVYNTDGTGQTKAQTVGSAVPAIYEMEIQNDGATSDRFIITGPAGGSGWTVRYYSAHASGTNITSEVTGAGKTTGYVAGGGSFELRVEVMPDASVPVSATKVLLITTTSVGDSNCSDTAKTVTIKAAEYQPDMLVRNSGETSYTGDDVHNTTGNGQAKAQTVAASQTAVYELKIQNDGNVSDSFTITGPAGGSGWTVTYYNALSGGSDITAQITGAGWGSGSLAAGASKVFRVEVSPDGTVPDQGTKSLLINATSDTDTGKSDAVKTATTKATVYQADMLVRNHGDPSYIGDAIYNNDGTNQTASQTAGSPVTYDLKIENDGNTSDTFTITGTAGTTNWTVTYYDALSGGTDITSQVTGAGWGSGSLAAGASVQFRVVVDPATAVPGNETFNVLVTGTSDTDGAKTDTVKTVTTKADVYQPDMLVRNSGQTTYVGDDIYNNDGTGQTKSQTTTSPVVYELKLENDGNASDTFTVTGTAGGSGWTVTYYSALTGGTDITSQVTGTGWATASLAPGASLELRVVVDPDASVSGGAVKNVLVTATSDTNNAKSDTVKTVTTKTAVYQPDMLVRNAGETTHVGDGIYNGDGSGQTKWQPVNPGVTATYELKVENDGNASDSFLITGTAGGAGWTVKYYDKLTGGANITLLVTGPGWPTPVLAPGAFAEFRVEVKPGGSVAGNITKDRLITATSVTDGLTSDTVKASTTTTATYQPDMMIRNAGTPGFNGDDVYNNDGTGQAVARTVDAGVAAKYILKLQNDGNATDTFVITGPVAPAGWTVAYYDADVGGTDITAQVTGAGWTTPALARYASLRMRVEATPNAGVAGIKDLEVLVSATSVGDSAKSDTVKATTTLTPTTFARNYTAGVWLIGIPAEPVNPSAAAVVGTTQVASFNAATQTYDYFSTTPFDLTPGMGCWVQYVANHLLSFDGHLPPWPVTRPVLIGWNLLANPGTGTLAWSNVAATGSVAAFGWRQNAAGTGYELVSNLPGLNTNQDIGPWKGFWLEAYENCQVTLGGIGGSAVAAQQDVIAWATQLCARAGGAVDDDNYIGVAQTAAAIVASNPPPIADGYVDLYVAEVNGARNAVSLIGAGGKTTWDLVAETDLPDTRVDVLFPDLSAVASDLAVVMTDLESGRTVNMRTARGYSFTSGADGARRRLQVEVKPRRQVAAILTNITAQAAAGGTQIVYTLSAAADVQMQVLNIAGRVVARIPGGYQNAGTHTAMWPGRSLSGSKIPAGQYLISVLCSSEDGTQTTRILPVHVR